MWCQDSVCSPGGSSGCWGFRSCHSHPTQEHQPLPEISESRGRTKGQYRPASWAFSQCCEGCDLGWLCKQQWNGAVGSPKCSFPFLGSSMQVKPDLWFSHTGESGWASVKKRCSLVKTSWYMGLRDCMLVESTCSFCRGPRVSFQHHLWWLITFLIFSARRPRILLCFCGTGTTHDTL